MRYLLGNNLLTIDGVERTDWFDIAIEILLGCLLLFMPFAFGAVEAWSEQVVISIVGLMAICLCLKGVFGGKAGKDSGSFPFVWSWAYVPVLLFILWAGGQLLSLPISVVKFISPNTYILKDTLLSELPGSLGVVEKPFDRATLSFYPWATRHDLRMLVAVAMVLLVVINVYRQESQIKRLLKVIAFGGGMVALLALGQGLFGNGKIYWVVPSGYETASSGPFINHSHFGQFMNLSIGAALGLLLIKLQEVFNRGSNESGFKKLSFSWMAGSPSKKQMRLVWLLVLMIIVGTATIFVSLSRGAMISLLVAGTFTAVILTANRNLQKYGQVQFYSHWIMALMALGAFVCVLYLGFDGVYNRLASLADQENYQSRWDILGNLSGLMVKFPIWGTGLGTHAVVYPMMDHSLATQLATHAENEYAQIITETGLVGFGLIVVLMVIVWRSYYRCIRSSQLLRRTVAIGLGFGIGAMMIHSFSDFGQHLPANACLSAVLCGLLINMADMSKKEEREQHKASGLGGYGIFGGRILAGGVLVLVVIMWVGMLSGAQANTAGERHWQGAMQIENKLRADKWAGSDEEYALLIERAGRAVNSQPGNVEYRYWLNVYRWKELSRGNGPKDEKYLSSVKDIIVDLQKARWLCPTYGMVYFMAGQLESFVIDDGNGSAVDGRTNGSRYIQTAYQLAPSNRQVCFAAGLEDVYRGAMEESLVDFKRYHELGGSFREIIDVYVNVVDRADLAVLLAVDNADKLVLIANELSRRSGEKGRRSAGLAKDIRKRALELYERYCTDPDTPAVTLVNLAQMCFQAKHLDKSIKYFRRAIALDGSQTNWRLGLARALAQNNQISQAIQEARLCVRRWPEKKKARDLLARWSILANKVVD